MESPTQTRKLKKLRKKSSTRTRNIDEHHIGTGTSLCNTKFSTQSTAMSLIAFIFVIYGYGFISSVMILPQINPKETSSLNHPISISKNDGAKPERMASLNIAKDGLVRNQDDDDEYDDEKDASGAGAADDDKDGAAIDDNDTGAGVVPASKWPVSITTPEEKENWIEIPHPGDSDIKLTVPDFWSMPIHNNKLMTKTQAMQIGTCAEPDPTTGSYQRGDDCPMKDRTIFVAIASYRDWQCRYTIESIFLRAAYPHRIRVAVVDQIVDGDDICNQPIESCVDDPDQALCKFSHQVDNYIMDAPLSVGPVFARHIGHRMYRGEYYSMQCDAHVTFTKGWDEDIIEQQEATGDEMTVLSTYLTDIVGSIDPQTGMSKRKTRPIMCNTDYEGGPQGKHLRHLSQPERLPPPELTMPQLSPYWAAGFSFSRGHFVVNVPYDLYQPMIFQGEEMSIGIRGFTIGYDYYAPQRSVCFHHYASQDRTHKRDNVPKFWENASKYNGIGKRSMARLLGIVNMNPEVDRSEWSHEDEDIYGLGMVRTPEKFYSTFGIDVVNKKTHQNLCSFVEAGRMHKLFIPKLRSDGMGIDYSLVKYQH